MADVPELSELSKTLYIPLVGRIYASRHYPSMIHDPKALGLESSLPEDAATMNRGQNEYTMVSSIARSVNMDRRIRRFLAAHHRRRLGSLLLLRGGKSHRLPEPPLRL